MCYRTQPYRRFTVPPSLHRRSTIVHHRPPPLHQRSITVPPPQNFKPIFAEIKVVFAQMNSLKSSKLRFRRICSSSWSLKLWYVVSYSLNCEFHDSSLCIWSNLWILGFWYFHSNSTEFDVEFLIFEFHDPNFWIWSNLWALGLRLLSLFNWIWWWVSDLWVSWS